MELICENFNHFKIAKVKMSYTGKLVLFLFNLFLISMFLFQYTSFGSFPGDTGDTKVVLMLLENFYSAILSSNKN